MKNRSRIQRAFTLIELLVVIAIIAILAAILFPVFAQAREAARKASCQSNEKQLGSAFMMYTQDFDERYPVRAPAPSGHWGYVIMPYIKNVGVFKCPSNPNATFAATGTPPAGQQVLPRSYAVVSYIHDNGFNGRAMASIDAPADRILITESTADWNDYAGWWWPNTNYDSSGFAGHSGSFNLLYHDGHVKTKKPTQTTATKIEWILGVNDANPNSCVAAGFTAQNCTDLISGMQRLETKYK